MNEVVTLQDLTPSALKLRSLVRILREDNERLTRDNRDLRQQLLAYEESGTAKRKDTLTVRDIQHRVAEHFRLEVSDLTSRAKDYRVMIPRQIAMVLCHKFTRLSLGDIGFEFGQRPKATVIYACRTIDNLSAYDKPVREAIGALRSMMTALGGVPATANA